MKARMHDLGAGKGVALPQGEPLNLPGMRAGAISKDLRATTKFLQGRSESTNRVPGADTARLDYFRVHAAQTQFFANRRTHEFYSVDTEALGKFFATGVVDRRHFDDRIAKGQARAVWQVLFAQFEIHVKLIAE